MNSKYVPGLVLATIGAGSAASLKAAQLARRADLPLAVSLVVVLHLVNIVAVPLWAGQVVTGASISAWDIVRSLLLLVLLPLLAGLFARARYTEHPNTEQAKTWQPELVEVANLAMVVALATGIAASWSTIVSMFGSWVIVTAIIIVLVAGVLGVLPGADAALVDFILPLALAVGIGHRTGATQPAPELAPGRSARLEAERNETNVLVFSPVRIGL
jgi:arsenite transporter